VYGETAVRLRDDEEKQNKAKQKTDYILPFRRMHKWKEAVVAAAYGERDQVVTMFHRKEEQRIRQN